MKKTLLVATAIMAAMAISCEKTPTGPVGEPSEYIVEAYGPSEVLDIAREVSKTVKVAAVTGNKGVAAQLTVTFKVDGSLVSEYNAGQPADRQASLLPAECYTITDNGCTIYPCSQQSTSAKITVTNLIEFPGDCYYVLPIVIDTIEGSDEATIASGSKLFFVFQFTTMDKGKGTKERPYRIYTKDDLMSVAEKTAITANVDDEPTYFRMEADVDLEGEAWTPVNANESLNKKVYFDGNHKTISHLTCKSGDHPSMFGVLSGEVFDLNIKDADIEGTTSVYGVGIVAGYVGRKGTYPGYIHNVSVSGNVKHCNKATGGICGVIEMGEVYACSVDARIEGTNNYVGGIFGFDRCVVNVHDCIVKGSVSASADYKCVGGIAGEFAQGTSGVENCICLADVTAGFAAGGIIGMANKDKSENINNDSREFVKGCIAWNNSVNAIATKSTGVMSSAPVVGFCAPLNTLENCWRKPDFKLNISHPEDPDAGKAFPIIDQDDANEDNPLKGINCDGGNNKNLMYCGKAAAAGETASDVAKRIGWDENIWDLTGSVPAIK